MSEWCRYNFDLLDHERIAGADLSHLSKAVREIMREAMHALYWRAVVTLQKQRSDDGLISIHALWGPLEARRGIAEELVSAGMLEPRDGAYYPRNYLEKNRSGVRIREALGGAAKRQADKRERERLTALAPQAPPPSHAGVTRDGRVTPVSVSVIGSDPDRKREPERQAAPTPDPSPLASGAAGFAAAGWVEGVRSVTGGRPTLAWWELRDLEELARDRPPDAEPAAWGHAEGATFARRQRASKPPMRVDARNYFAWVGDGRQGPLDRTAVTMFRPPDVPSTTPDARATARALRDRDAGGAVPPPAGFAAALDAVGGS